MLKTKLNRPTLSNDLLHRDRLVEKLQKHSHLPLILVSAPAGFGKSILVSQWLERYNNGYSWLSLDESMNDPATFLAYLIEMIERSGHIDIDKLKVQSQNMHSLSWEAIIVAIVNAVNELKAQTTLVLDDYYLIKTDKIHALVSALINADLDYLKVVIITRWDPPFSLRGQRLYGRMLELRMRDLRFEKSELTQLLANEKQIKFSSAELDELTLITEGWILAIRMIIGARSFPETSQRKEKSLIFTTDLDTLMDHISENLDPDFFRQMQLCALCDQFNTDLIEFVFNHTLKDSDGAEQFLSKLRGLNFFLIPAEDDGTWYRFHQLIGNILRRQLERSEPAIISPLYIEISEWFSENNLLDEAVRYAVKAKNYELACEHIIKHSTGKLDQGQWWVVQRWLNIIPRQIRKANIDLLLVELLICEETWNLEDLFSILETLKSVGIENSSDKNISVYLYHLGYFLTFVKPDPKIAVESLERSKALYHDESYMFGARREFILACSRQMLGLTALALKSLEEIEEGFDPFSNMYVRSIHGKMWINVLSGNFDLVYNDSIKLLFLVQDSDLLQAKVWGWYFQGNVAFQSYNKYEVINTLKETLTFEGVLNYRVYFDALAGLILINSLRKDEKATASFLEQMSQLTEKLKDTKFQNYFRSIQARVKWHKGLGGEELSWANNDSVKQHPSSYFFLMDVPELTKLRIVVSHGSHAQVGEAISALKEVEDLLESIHNHYQRIDVVLLKAMGYLRLGKGKSATKYLEEALILADKIDMFRPIMEAYRVMPELFNQITHTDAYNSLLGQIGIYLSSQKSASVSSFKDDTLTARERDIVELVSKGLQNKEIAAKLNISTVTVKSHLTNIFNKLGVSNRVSMIRILQDR